MKEIIDNFTNIECPNEYNHVSMAETYINKNQKIELPEWCTNKLKNSIFSKMTVVDSSPLMLYNWISHYIY